MAIRKSWVDAVPEMIRFCDKDTNYASFLVNEVCKDFRCACSLGELAEQFNTGQIPAIPEKIRPAFAGFGDVALPQGNERFGTAEIKRLRLLYAAAERGVDLMEGVVQSYRVRQFFSRDDIRVDVFLGNDGVGDRSLASLKYFAMKAWDRVNGYGGDDGPLEQRALGALYAFMMKDKILVEDDTRCEGRRQFYADVDRDYNNAYYRRLRRLVLEGQ